FNRLLGTTILKQQPGCVILHSFVIQQTEANFLGAQTYRKCHSSDQQDPYEGGNRLLSRQVHVHLLAFGLSSVTSFLERRAAARRPCLAAQRKPEACQKVAGG